MTSSSDDSLTLRFFDPQRPARQAAPASVVARSLDALQRLVHLIAMRRDGRTPGRRIRPSADIQGRYRLVCEPLQTGSLVAPVRLEGAGLLAPAEQAAVLADLDAVLAAAGANDEAAFQRAAPDETWRRFYLEALDRLAPPVEAGVELEIGQAGRLLLASVRARPFVARLARAPTRKAQRGAVVGEFKRIDFARREITIRHNLTGKDLTCVYEDHVEQSLLEHPRDQLLVFGTVTRDADARPVSIEEVDHIEPIDLEPIAIERVMVGDRLIRTRAPLAAQVAFDEADALYLAEIGSLNVSVCAETRELLAAALQDDLAVLWSRYACARDDKLTAAAQALKQRMLAAFEEATGAA